MTTKMTEQLNITVDGKTYTLLTDAWDYPADGEEEKDWSEANQIRDPNGKFAGSRGGGGGGRSISGSPRQVEKMKEVLSSLPHQEWVNSLDFKTEFLSNQEMKDKAFGAQVVGLTGFGDDHKVTMWLNSQYYGGEADFGYAFSSKMNETVAHELGHVSMFTQHEAIAQGGSVRDSLNAIHGETSKISNYARSNEVEGWAEAVQAYLTTGTVAGPKTADVFRAVGLLE